MTKLLDKFDRDKTLEVLSEWNDDNDNEFVEEIIFQIMDKDFLTRNQFRALCDIVPELEG